MKPCRPQELPVKAAKKEAASEPPRAPFKREDVISVPAKVVKAEQEPLLKKQETSDSELLAPKTNLSFSSVGMELKTEEISSTVKQNLPLQTYVHRLKC